MSGVGGRMLVCKNDLGSFESRSSTHWQATVITDSKSLLISLQPDCLHRCE